MNCPQRDFSLPRFGVSRNKGAHFVKMTPEDDGILQTGNSKRPGEGPAPTPTRDGNAGGRRGAVRVVVADDHEALRHCLCRLLRDTGDLEVVGQAANGQEALDQLLSVPDPFGPPHRRDPEVYLRENVSL